MSSSQPQDNAANNQSNLTCEAKGKAWQEIDGRDQVPSEDVVLRFQEDLLTTRTLLSRPGLEVVLYQQRTPAGGKIFFRTEQNHLELSYRLWGRSRHALFTSESPPLVGDTHARHWTLNLIGECKGYFEFLPYERCTSLSIIIDPRTSIYDSWNIDHLLHSARAGNRPSACISGMVDSGIISPAMLAVVNQIVSCPYTDPARACFLEAKSMELIALQMAAVSQDRKNVQHWNLGDEYQLAVRRARDILVADLNNPPKLTDLARQVGLNRNKLNQGFREVYGATVFEVLRSERLKQAVTLLEAGGMPLTEIAQTTGYCALSHFTSAFSAHFGVSPRQYLKTQDGSAASSSAREVDAPD
jgi:AraC-like DNA-binding protein